MKILSVTFVIFLAGHSVQSLSCHSCPTDTSFNDCLTNVESVTCTVGWNQCFNMKYFLKKSSGEEVLYLDKQCALDFICNNPDPKYVCNAKNTTFIDAGHELINCTSRCCTTDMCNNDYLPTPPIAPPEPSIALSAAVSATVAPGNHTGNNVTAVPSTPRTGNTSTTATPAGCGTGSIKMPRRMIIALAAMLKLAFKLM
ncbi:hypothetical protein ACROYT_G007858 [Oculina patagonica]